MKLCVFQGTFNPVHNGHLQMASYIRDHFDFDKILFIPAHKPPHKNVCEILPEHRLNMVKLAIENEKGFDVSDIEFQTENPSYTVYTIQELYKLYDIEGEIAFIIGFDAFNSLQNWFKYEELIKLVHFLVFARGEKLDKDSLSLLNYSKYKFEFVNMEPVDISSTIIRDMTAHKRPIGMYVPQAVEEYINKYGLYRN